MKSTVTWTGNRAFEGTTEDGFRVSLGQKTDTTPKPGPSAMELILMGTGGCSIFDVVSKRCPLSLRAFTCISW